MRKSLYSYRDCLVYSLCLLKKHCKGKSFLSKQEELCCALITLCRKSPASFWVHLQKQELSCLEYRRICQKVSSYLLKEEPVPYISKECFFSGIPIKIRKGVFIPQSDTELLVNVVLSLGEKICFPSGRTKILEIGCGSGNIAIALALRKISWDILATDISRKALSLSKENASILNVTNTKFLLSDKFSRVTGKFDIIVSNPPYVSSSGYSFLSESVKKQPMNALLSAGDGYFFYEAIIGEVSSFLREKFLVAFEIGHDQSRTVIKIILRHFPSVKIETFRDFSRNIRVIAFYQ